MEKICFNGRDELLVLDCSKIACFKADDDYSVVYYTNGLVVNVPIGLSKICEALAHVPRSLTCDFMRVGRSFMVNHAYLYQISVPRQRLALYDGQKILVLNVAKEALKRYKEAMAERFRVDSPKNPDVSPQKP